MPIAAENHMLAAVVKLDFIEQVTPVVSSLSPAILLLMS
jgi:hypothetical protein